MEEILPTLHPNSRCWYHTRPPVRSAEWIATYFSRSWLSEEQGLDIVFNGSDHFTIQQNTEIERSEIEEGINNLIEVITKEYKIKGYSIEMLIHKINEIPKSIHQKNIFLAVCRYLVFSHQYYFLFLAFDVDLPYFTMMATIASVYFLASSLPTFQFLDFAVKGSVAVYFFGIIGVNEWIVVFISTLMWFLNVVLPVIIGSYYVMNFKTKIAQ